MDSIVRQGLRTTFEVCLSEFEMLERGKAAAKLSREIEAKRAELKEVARRPEGGGQEA